MLFFYQHANSLLSCIYIIHQHTVAGYSLDHTVDKHNGLTSFLKFIQMGSCHIYRHIDNSIHTFPGKEIHCFFFKLLICSAVTDNRCISMASEDILHSTDDFCAENIVQLWNHNPHCLGRIGLQTAGNFIYFVM